MVCSTIFFSSKFQRIISFAFIILQFSALFRWQSKCQLVNAIKPFKCRCICIKIVILNFKCQIRKHIKVSFHWRRLFYWLFSLTIANIFLFVILEHQVFRRKTVKLKWLANFRIFLTTKLTNLRTKKTFCEKPQKIQVHLQEIWGCEEGRYTGCQYWTPITEKPLLALDTKSVVP